MHCVYAVCNGNSNHKGTQSPGTQTTKFGTVVRNIFSTFTIPSLSFHTKMCISSQATSKKCQITVISGGNSIIWALGMVLASCHPSSTWNLVVTARFLENLWIPNHKTTVGLTGCWVKIQSPYFINTK